MLNRDANEERQFFVFFYVSLRHKHLLKQSQFPLTLPLSFSLSPPPTYPLSFPFSFTLSLPLSFHLVPPTQILTPFKNATLYPKKSKQIKGTPRIQPDKHKYGYLNSRPILFLSQPSPTEPPIQENTVRRRKKSNY